MEKWKINRKREGRKARVGRRETSGKDKNWKREGREGGGRERK